MKSNKVLLGLFVGLMALAGGASNAQIREVGPANIGGHISSIVVDRQNTDHTTVYAGAISGGLYVRTDDTTVLRTLYSDLGNSDYATQLVNNSDSWHRVRYITTDGFEQNLPVSALAQGPDGTIFVGTGDDTYTIGSTYSKMSAKGCGIFRYNPAEGTFALIPYTSPAANQLFGAVHALDCHVDGNTLYLFAATNSGLYRWTVDMTAGDAAWSANPVRIGETMSIDQLVVIRGLNMAYFTSGNQLFRLSDLNGTTPINITSANSAFGGTSLAIKLAVAPSDNRYLYAMVIGANGLMENIYLTTNGQVWTPLATSSVMPLTFNSGTTCGAIVVDPGNPKHIYVAGTNIWSGEGFLEGAIYQWTKNSYSEYELNSGDYMSAVFNNTVFVHSGIHQIVSHYQVIDGEPRTTYYIATDGGIYSTTSFYMYNNINRGMNSVQVNSVAVSPDGSLISGANNNACPFIEARLEHNGGQTIPSWYDDGSMGNMNHDANILWSGNGGKVAASSFQQLTPQSIRNIFVSSSNANIGRAKADYMDYTNNQTWTFGNQLLTSEMLDGPAIGSISLWENADDHYYKDSIRVGIDLRGSYIKANGDSVSIDNNPNTIIPVNAKVTFLSKNNSDYPFEYTFSKSQKAGDTLVVKNPVVSRLLVIANTTTTQSSVMLTWMPNDFSKIYDSVIDADRDLDDAVKESLREKFMWWAPIFNVKRNTLYNTMNLYIRDAIMSADGRCAFISTYDRESHKSQLYRIGGLAEANYYQYPANTRRQLNYASDSTVRVLTEAKFTINNNEWFNRPISSIAVDPNPERDRIVITFEDYSDGNANVLVIDSASTDNWINHATYLPITGFSGIPAYCAMIEDSTGNIYVGTDNGYFIYNGTSWKHADDLRGVAVTSIVQQTKKLAVRRASNHTGITENKYLFAKTKWPRAIYYGTYGRGIFIDMTYVTDSTNEVSDPEDYNPVSIPTVDGIGTSSVSIYPNPVMGEANLQLNANEAGTAVLRIYDLNGRMVGERQLGFVAEGEHVYSIGTEGLAKGMYLVNVIIGGHTAATKMVVR